MAQREPEAIEPSTPWEFAQSVLFTGHMIDAATRAEPRFPARAESASAGGDSGGGTAAPKRRRRADGGRCRWREWGRSAVS